MEAGCPIERLAKQALTADRFLAKSLKIKYLRTDIAL